MMLPSKTIYLFSAKNGEEHGNGVELACVHTTPTLAPITFFMAFKCLLIGSEYLTGLIVHIPMF